MKSLFLVFLLGLSTTSMALECNQQEAQFIGNAVDFFIYQDDYAQIGECTFKLKIDPDNYRPSVVPGCALDYNEVLNTTYSYDFYHTAGVNECPVTEDGQEISGYLVKKDGKIIIE